MWEATRYRDALCTNSRSLEEIRSYGGRCARARVCMCGRMLRPCAICECVFICVFYTRGSLCMRLCIRVKKKKNRRKNRRYASDSHVASVILSVYYAKRWAGNNSFSRVLRSIRFDPIHRSSFTVLRAKGLHPSCLKPCALRENTRDEICNDSQGRICAGDHKIFRVSTSQIAGDLAK